MTPDQVFGVVNPMAMLGWLFLVFAPRFRFTQTVARTIPLMLAATYLLLLITHWGEAKGGFGTLSDVASLFANSWVLLAGWIHYLAFDLFTGAWEARDAMERGIPHWMVIPCLLLTFLFGPVGLLLYFGVRTLHKTAAAGH